MYAFSKPFLDLVSTDVFLDEEIRNLIGRNCKLVTIEKGELLPNAGDVCKNKIITQI